MTMEQIIDEANKLIFACILGMLISVMFMLPQISNKDEEINQLKQENEKLTNIIIEINKE